jgi:hypothetical protein
MVTSRIERTGVHSPMKIRVGSFYNAEKSSHHSTSLLPNLLPGRGVSDAHIYNGRPHVSAVKAADDAVRLPRLGIHCAANDDAKASGWCVHTGPLKNLQARSWPIATHGHPGEKPIANAKREKLRAIAKNKVGGSRGKANVDATSLISAGKQFAGDKASHEGTRRRSLLCRLAAEDQDVSLAEVIPHLAAAAQDPYGSAFLQACLPEAPTELKTLVLSALLPSISGVCMQQFGHAFVIQLLNEITVEQLRLIAGSLAPHVKQISLDVHGCRVIQKALQVMPRDASEHLIAGLKDSVIQCVKSMHANHVFQVCIEELPSPSVDFLVDACESWGAEAVASHIYGCRVLLRLLEYVPRHRLQLVFNQLFQNVLKLAQDRYGNYVLQHVLDHCEISDKLMVIAEVLKAGAFELAKQKYAHNVMEKCIQVALAPDNELGLEHARESLCNDLFWRDGCSSVLSLATDRFGSKVVLSALNHFKGSHLVALRNVLRGKQEELKEFSNCEALLSKLHVDV